MGMVDNTLFTKKKSSNLIIVQIYVDDIIFGSTCQDMCDDFAKIMHDEFEMSMMGELNFFLGLQIKQMEDGIFFNQSKYIKEMLKKFGLEDSKPMKTPMSSDTKLTKDEECESVDSTKYRGMIGTTHLGLWYPKGTGIETIVYADSDHAGDYVDRKSTSGICTFVGCCLTSWFSKKQTALAISTTEAEYVSAGKACQQALWMKQALIDYDVRLDDVPIMCDNKGAIDLSKNPVQHSHQYYSFSLEEFAKILGVPCEGARVFTDKWALYELANGLLGDGGNRDHVPAYLCLMIYCIANSLNFNLAYFMAKRMEWVSRQSNLILPYGMFLTKILTHILNENPELQNPSYVLYDRVMEPLSSSQEQKPRRDRGTRKGRTSTSLTPAFGEPSSSHPTNDDEDVDHNEDGNIYDINKPRFTTWKDLDTLFSVGQFCDSNLEVAFRQHTCFIHNLEGVDLLTGSRGNNLYTMSLGDMMASSPICLLSKVSKTKSWLWHQRLSHLNFGAINHLARHDLVHGLLSA
ncbi:retrovirus-related pol polyprotein from transposon TNT 1-94 [Tanacetum coccineum]